MTFAQALIDGGIVTDVEKLEQLADQALEHRLAAPIQHVQRGRGDRAPNRDRARAREHGFLLCSDEAYSELWFEDEAIWRGTAEYLSTTVMNDAVVGDEMNLFHRSTMRMALVEECETDMGVYS